MSQILLEFDNTLTKSDIVVPLLSSSKAESGDTAIDSSMTEKSQTAVFGIQVPLICINNVVIDFDAIKYFSLKSEGPLPELVLTVEDRFEFTNNIDRPGVDNEVRVQIIPRHDNTYKKINLTFFITSVRVIGKLISMTCMYKLSSLTSTQFEAFGEIDTYSAFKEIAKRTGLGFATNISNTGDERYIYSDNKSFLELMNDEIQQSGVDSHILEYWIDFWDNINLVDIQERYKTIDSDEDISVWCAGQIHETNSDVEVSVYKTPAVITNLPSQSNSELFAKQYEILTNPGGNIANGTDRVFTTYETHGETKDFLVQDGDVKNDVFIKYEYLGETYGSYNKLIARAIRKGFIQKITSEKIQLTLTTPMLGLMRGHRVNFIRYTNSDMIENKMSNLEAAGVIDRTIESNISLTEYDIIEDSGSGRFVLDRATSGQYLIYGVNIVYNENWNYVLTLIRDPFGLTNIKNS